MTQHRPPVPYRSNPWTLEFRDRGEECDFTRSWIRRTLGITQIWAVCGMLFYAGFTLAAMWFCVPEPMHGQLLLRLYIVLPVLIAAQAIQFVLLRKAVTKAWTGHWLALRGVLDVTYLIQTLTAFCSSLLLFVTLPQPCNQIFLYEMAVIFVFCQHYQRVRFPLMMLFSIACGTATIGLIAINPKASTIAPELLYLVVTGLALVGIFAAYTRETFIRRNYRDIRILRAEKAVSERLAEQSQEASRAKSRFLAMMSHELRTPLNAIIGFSDMMRAGVFGAMPQPQYRTYVGDIGSSGRHLLHIVNHILDLTKAEEGRIALKREALALDEFFDELRRNFAAEFEAAGIALRTTTDSPGQSLFVDHHVLRQIVSNLVSNGLKFTPAGGCVTIGWARRPDGGCEISVADTGIGIAPADMKRALELFGQVDDGLNRKYNGAGIGLPLTKALVEAHGGVFEIESAPGKGTTVRLGFPPAARTTTPDSAAPGAPSLALADGGAVVPLRRAA